MVEEVKMASGKQFKVNLPNSQVNVFGKGLPAGRAGTASTREYAPRSAMPGAGKVLAKVAGKS
jgi:hypothetical protein